MQLAGLGFVRSVIAAVEMRQIGPGKNFATVTTVFLGAVQRFVGGFNQSINVVRNFGRRNADTDRKAERFTFIRIDDQFGNGFTQTVSNDFSFFRTDIGKIADKLLAAITGDDVAVAQSAFGRGRQLYQHLVPDFVAISVVNVFELVGVNHQYGITTALHPRQSNTLGYLLFKITTVVKRGQRIAHGLILEQGFAVFARGNVLKGSIERNVVVVIDDVGRGKQPERRVTGRSLDQNFKVLHFFFLFQPFIEQTAVFGVGKKVPQPIAVQFGGLDTEQFDGIVVGQNQLGRRSGAK